MSGVKQSCLRRLALPLLAGAGVFAVTGCESGDLARFAPPGIVKYEDLAGDQPVNPDVAQRIEERRAEKGAGKFPRLAETPDEEDRQEKSREPNVQPKWRRWLRLATSWPRKSLTIAPPPKPSLSAICRRRVMS